MDERATPTRWQKYVDDKMADPDFRAIYEEEAQKKEVWLQLVEAREAAGLTQSEIASRMGVSQAQVSRIEKEGYTNQTLATLRRYVEALGTGFKLTIEISMPQRSPMPQE